MQGKVGRSVGFLKVSLVLKETKSLGLGKQRRGSEGLIACVSLHGEGMWSCPPHSKFQVPGGVLCEFGEQSSGRLLQFAGQGSAEQWLGLGQNLKGSFLRGAPLELG